MKKFAMLGLGLTAALGLSAGPATALTASEKCEADKLKTSAKYVFCRLKADSKAIRTGSPPDYSTCDQKIVQKFGLAETLYGVACPTSGDVAGIQSQAAGDTNFLALKLSGARFVDNGDGTVTDVETGLMWEKKDDLGGIHDKDNVYAWSATGTSPDGAVFTTFLGALNDNQSTDGTRSAVALRVTATGACRRSESCRRYCSRRLRVQRIRASIRSSAPRSPSGTGHRPPTQTFQPRRGSCSSPTAPSLSTSRHMAVSATFGLFGLSESIDSAAVAGPARPSLIALAPEGLHDP